MCHEDGWPPGAYASVHLPVEPPSPSLWGVMFVAMSTLDGPTRGLMVACQLL